MITCIVIAAAVSILSFIYLKKYSKALFYVLTVLCVAFVTTSIAFPVSQIYKKYDVYKESICREIGSDQTTQGYTDGEKCYKFDSLNGLGPAFIPFYSFNDAFVELKGYEPVPDRLTEEFQISSVTSDPLKNNLFELVLTTNSDGNRCYLIYKSTRNGGEELTELLTSKTSIIRIENSSQPYAKITTDLQLDRIVSAELYVPENATTILHLPKEDTLPDP